MPGTDEGQVVVWEERPHGLDWVSWGVRVVPLAPLFLLLAYGIFRVPGPLAYRMVGIAALTVGAAMLVVFGRRTAARAPGRITLDLERRRLYAENLELERGFWRQGRTPFYECGFDDIISIRIRRARTGKWLQINCSGARLTIDDESTGFYELLAALRAAVPEKGGWSREDIVTCILTIGAAALICWACVHFGWI